MLWTETGYRLYPIVQKYRAEDENLRSVLDDAEKLIVMHNVEELAAQKPELRASINNLRPLLERTLSPSPSPVRKSYGMPPKLVKEG